jgi:dipeptidase D
MFEVKEIAELQPKEFWENFAAICQIPHPSGKEAQLRSFIKDFAEKLGLNTLVDEAGNLIVKKPATAGMENCQGVILQAHLDMVPQKNADVVHDFAVDPIQPYIDDGWVKAKGTTLGADDGFGLAAMMAILQSKTLKHGPIEALFTVDEEVGLTGAMELKPGLLAGEILFNLDSDIEGEITIGSAGGVFIDGEFSFSKIAVPANVNAFSIKVHGLKGGHSAVEIDKPMANAIKILGRLLWLSKEKFALNLVTIEGGNAYNAIPREAVAVVTVAAEQSDLFKKIVADHAAKLVKQFAELKDLKIELTANSLPNFMWEPKDQAKLLNLLYACPHGIIAMSKDIPGVIETSTNLAMVKTNDNNFKVSVFPRSAIEFMVEDLANTAAAFFKLAGGQVKFSDKFPSWQPVANAPIVELMAQVYAKNFGEKPKITATHGGTECGVLLLSYPNLQIVSFGPTVENAHSPNERLNIKTVKKYWELLIAVLANIPQK